MQIVTYIIGIFTNLTPAAMAMSEPDHVKVPTASLADTESSPLLDIAGNSPVVRPRVTNRFLFVTGCILFMELCERLTFYSITSNQVIFGTNVLKYTTGEAVNINFIFTGKFSRNTSVIYRKRLIFGYMIFFPRIYLSCQYIDAFY